MAQCVIFLSFTFPVNCVCVLGRGEVISKPISKPIRTSGTPAFHPHHDVSTEFQSQISTAHFPSTWPSHWHLRHIPNPNRSTPPQTWTPALIHISGNVNSTFAVTQGPDLEVILDSLSLTSYMPSTSSSYHLCLQIHPRSDRFLPPQSPPPWPTQSSPHLHFRHSLPTVACLTPIVYSHSGQRGPFKT